MKLLVEIDEKKYVSIKKCLESGMELDAWQEAVANGTPLPKGHGRLIDADAFIDGLRDASKRQRYNKCLIDEFLTVEDVFQAVIESLENKGLAEGDAPTIIEACKEEQSNDE